MDKERETINTKRNVATISQPHKMEPVIRLATTIKQRKQYVKLELEFYVALHGDSWHLVTSCWQGNIETTVW